MTSDTTAFPTSTASLLFPLASQSLSSTISSLKRSAHSTSNRLRSIYQDSLFIEKIAARYNLPLVANERCGSWYVPPEKKMASAYFKSTDGHYGQWAFSKRRLNLHVLDVIERCGGCIIVDSTRRGKSMPDALSKTVPIWCAVINRLLFDEFPESHRLHTLEEVLGQSEHNQIEACLDKFVGDAKSLELDISKLRSVLQKPLRPLWVSPNLASARSQDLLPEYHSVILCTASRAISGEEFSEDGYIQGAGDDSESWSYGLTPSLFWEHREALLITAEDELESLIQQLLAKDTTPGTRSSRATRIGSTNLFIGSLPSASEMNCYDGIIVCSDVAPQGSGSESKDVPPMETLHLLCCDGKLGSRALRRCLPQVPAFIASLKSNAYPPKVLFACKTGRDLSVGVALTVLSLFFDDGYKFSIEQSSSIDKARICRRLAYITAAKADANPSRSTLQSVNSFLMPRKD